MICQARQSRYLVSTLCVAARLFSSVTLLCSRPDHGFQRLDFRKIAQAGLRLAEQAVRRSCYGRKGRQGVGRWRRGRRGSVALGKGAWDCDKNCEIAPEKEVRPQRRIFLCKNRTLICRKPEPSLLGSYLGKPRDIYRISAYCCDARQKYLRRLPPWNFHSKAFPRSLQEKTWTIW